jgi:para-nitrobenzyl esterase
VIAVYRRKYPDATAADINVLLATDYPLAYRSILMAQRKAAQHGAPVYASRFDWETPVNHLRSPHTLEVPFVFDNIRENPARNGGGPEAVALAARLSEAWIAFARLGDPNTAWSGLPHWPAYDLDRRATMLFNNNSQISDDPVREERLIIEACLPPGAAEA